jgi:hypothetical protein
MFFAPLSRVKMAVVVWVYFQPLWKSVWKFLKKLKSSDMIQPYHFYVYSIHIKTNLLQKQLYTHVYHSTIHNTQIWNQPGCPSTGEWIRKMWHIHTMEFYSAIKNNEIMSFAGKWMELEIIQFHKDSIACFLSFMEVRGKQNKINIKIKVIKEGDC